MSVNKLVSGIQTNKSRVIAGAIAAAAVAFPLYASLTTAETASETTAAPRCLAWFGNQADGHCLSYSNGSGVTVGSPNVGFGENGFGVYTGPLMPGTTISQGIGQWGN
ncbi:hypothetical protein PDG61_05075 [Mycolicibacterium sp. BiH015]|uniref:DUF7155 family protein n=1 Tax=Mycolicibacterium sp. BiH015 TaxID=3018808 RepID=UPI0022E3CDE7|nr:hypothetical protein [Mycolicibacterium sp. BiH015]MDA2890276.1 hypothetical protein [Mycolicibacterium sp. BiH015]